MANDGDGFLLVEEMTHDPQQVLVVAQVLGRAAAGDEQAVIVVGIDVPESNSRFDVVAGAFARDIPAGRNLVHHHGVDASVLTGDNSFKAVLLHPEKRV